MNAHVEALCVVVAGVMDCFAWSHLLLRTFSRAKQFPLDSRYAFVGRSDMISSSIVAFYFGRSFLLRLAVVAQLVGLVQLLVVEC